MADIRQSLKYKKYMEMQGWVVERINNTNYFIKKFPLVPFSFMKIQRPEKIDLKVIKNLQKKHRVVQTIIEPLNIVEGYKITTPFIPSKTLILNITRSEKQILTGMKKNTRNIINNKIQVLSIKKLVLSEIPKFRKAWRKALPWTRYVPPQKNLISLKKAFGNNILLVTIKNSGAVFIKSDDMAYYWHGFTGKEGRKHFAQYKLVWEGIKWAKKSGAKKLDFEGVYDERFPNKAWKGFSAFKRGFGGKEKIYPGAFKKWL